MKYEFGYYFSYLNIVKLEKNILYMKTFKILIKVKNCIKIINS